MSVKEERGQGRRGSFLWILLFLLVVCVSGVTGEAAGALTIQSCRIDPSNHGRVEVTATGSPYVSGTDGNYYLVALLPYEKSVSQKSILAGTLPQQSLVKYGADLNLNSTASLLYRKFAIAVKRNHQYQIVSNYQYLTNPEVLAPVTKAFPKAASKKGLHIKPTMISDAEDLGIKHAAVNICLDTFLPTGSQKNASSSYSYYYQGKQYWFLKSGCSEVDSQTKQLAQSNVIVSGILLLRNNYGGKVLIAPDARGAGKNYYGFNTMNQEGVETLEALMHFLGDRYMNSNGKYGTVVNWIVGDFRIISKPIPEASGLWIWHCAAYTAMPESIFLWIICGICFSPMANVSPPGLHWMPLQPACKRREISTGIWHFIHILLR